MKHLSRIHVLLLLLLPALFVPRGVLLGYCLCTGADGGCCAEVVESCCSTEASAGCCGGEQDPDDGEDQLVSPEDCACCGSIEVEDFDEAIPGAPKAPDHVAAVALHLERVDAPRLARLGRVAPARAPPRVVPSGLRPGTAPLRL